ncbi:hypothetical protein DL96DRAFT_1596637 [Flagelloscypha sp. PMI_526]|nr:hypothetical protein DL96DRAFT_1596637 [Flagelloscypha sp. PMI_526]
MSSSASDLQQLPATSTSSKKTKKVEVKDDWEDSEEDEQDAETVWNNANTKPAAAMPTIVTPTAIPSLPHKGAFEPKMRILKRPSPAPSSTQSSPSSSSNVTPTLQEREAQYNAARSRIFASTDANTDGKTSNNPSGSDSTTGAK